VVIKASKNKIQIISPPERISRAGNIEYSIINFQKSQNPQQKSNPRTHFPSYRGTKERRGGPKAKHHFEKPNIFEGRGG
jgi:hypothetical protein